MKRHRDFFGKPATSRRQKIITWNQNDAKEALEKLRLKLMCQELGGGKEAFRRKFENLARLESDDDLTAKLGGDLGPQLISKRKKLFGDNAIMTAVKGMKLGTMSEVIESAEGVHVV